MAQQAIEKIRQAEDEAARIVAEAQAKARELLKEEERQIRMNDAKSMEQAAQEAEKMKAIARQDAEESVQGMLEEGKAAVGTITGLPEERVNQAATAILERIVKSNGNR